jgi:uncharacterized protein YlzI (FlbEa/FlbD family)
MLTVFRFTGKLLIFEPTFDGTVENDPSFAIGLFAGKDLPDQVHKHKQTEISS